MSKMQKIWLWIFLALFLLPEFLWSPISNFIYSIFTPTINGSIQTLRENYLINSDTIYYILTLTIQFLGLFGIIYSISKTKFNPVLKVLILIILGCLAIITVFITYILFSTRNGIGF